MWRSVTTAAAAREAVRALKREGAQFVKIQSSLSRECLIAVADESKRRHLRFAGHVPEALSAFEVIAAGPASLEHVSPSLPPRWGLMRACSSDERGCVIAARAERGGAGPRSDSMHCARAAARASRTKLEPWDERDEALFHDLNTHGTHVVPTWCWSQSLRALDSTDTGGIAPLQYVPRAMRERWRNGRRRTSRARPAKRWRSPAHGRALARAGPRDARGGGSR